MNNLTNDWIAIDTNIFEHVLRSNDVNKGAHIDCVLTVLMKDRIVLLVDSGSRIEGEYVDRLKKRIKEYKSKDKNDIFNYFFTRLPCKKVDVDNDNLIKAIKQVLPRGAGTDAIFVYVAFCTGRILLTNDRRDIIDEGTKRNERRKKLLDQTEQWRPKKQGEILTSQEAHDRLNGILTSGGTCDETSQNHAERDRN